MELLQRESETRIPIANSLQVDFGPGFQIPMTCQGPDGNVSLAPTLQVRAAAGRSDLGSFIPWKLLACLPLKKTCANIILGRFAP